MRLYVNLAGTGWCLKFAEGVTEAVTSVSNYFLPGFLPFPWVS